MKKTIITTSITILLCLASTCYSSSPVIARMFNWNTFKLGYAPQGFYANTKVILCAHYDKNNKVYFSDSFSPVAMCCENNTTKTSQFYYTPDNNACPLGTSTSTKCQLPVPASNKYNQNTLDKVSYKDISSYCPTKPD